MLTSVLSVSESLDLELPQLMPVVHFKGKGGVGICRPCGKN